MHTVRNIERAPQPQTQPEWTPADSWREASVAGLFENYKEFRAGQRDAFDIHFPLTEALNGREEDDYYYERLLYEFLEAVGARPYDEGDTPAAVAADGTIFDFTFIPHPTTGEPIHMIMSARQQPGLPLADSA